MKLAPTCAPVSTDRRQEKISRADPYLVGGLVELLGIKRGADADRDARAEQNVVGDGGHTTVVDLALSGGVRVSSILSNSRSSCCFHFLHHGEESSGEEVLGKPGPGRGYYERERARRKTYLDEGHGVQAVLAGNLEADGVARGAVPGGLGAGLDLAIDLVVVAGSEDAQVVRGGDGGGVDGVEVADGGAVARDGRLVDVVGGRATGHEALVGDDGVDVGRGALEQVEKGAGMEVALLEVQVELSAPGVLSRQEGEDALRLEALSQ